MAIPIFLSLLFIGYSILLFFYWRSWKSIPVFRAGESPSCIPVSIVIPARNEQENIGRLLQALQNQKYPAGHLEIIVVDDHSTDKTASIVALFPSVRLISLSEDSINSYKKKAIEKGIRAATGELIVTTDADCIPPPGWLQMIVSFKLSTNAVFVAAPVVIDGNRRPLQIFQAMDFMVLQGITGASVFKQLHAMCNGANLAYEKKVFYEVGGFAGIDKIASGDDMLLMHKIAKKYPGRIHYLKSSEATVSTKPMQTWKDFFNQRIRWASKALYYEDKTITGVLLLVYVFNLSFLCLGIAGFWDPSYWICFLLAWIIKTFAELPFFYSVAAFFNKRWTVRLFFFFQPIHILYTIISGSFGQLGKYEWKGRKVN